MYLKKTNLLSNSKINLLWLLLFSIAFFALLIGFTTTTQAAVPPPQGPYLEVNTSQNWINLRNFPSGGQVNVQVNGGDKLVDDFTVDSGGNWFINLWEYGTNIQAGDQVVATYSGGSINMTVDTITVGSFDVVNDRVWGTVTEPQNNNKPNYWQVTIFADENSGNELGSRDGGPPAIPNGDYFANFATDPKVDIQPLNVAWVRSFDDFGNQSILVTSAPKLEVDVTNNNVNGRYFNTATVDIKIRDSQNNIKVEKNGVQTENGNFNTDFWDSGEQNILNFGDTVIVEYGSNSVQFTIPPINNIVVDKNARTVSGTVNPQTSGDVSVNRRYSGEMLSYRPYNADDQGNFTVDFSFPTGQPWQGVVNEFDHTKDIRIDNKTVDGHSVVVHTGTPTIKANFSHNWIEAQYLPMNADLTVKVNDSDNLQLSRNSGIGGRISVNGNDFGQDYQVSPDDNIKIFQGPELIAEMNVSRITGMVNTADDTVGGEVKHGLDNPSDSTVQVEVSGNEPWEQRNRLYDLSDSSNYLADFKVPETNKLNIKPTHEIQVTETDNTNGNQTIMWTGAPKLGAHLNDKWIEGQNLQPGVEYTVVINDDDGLQFSKTPDNSGSFRIESDEFEPKNYQVKPDDNIKVLQGANLISQMNVSEITASVNTDANTVMGFVYHQGKTPAPDSLVRIEVNTSQDPSWEQRHRDTQLTNSSEINVWFGQDDDEYDPYDIQPRDELEITETDNRNGNQTIARAGSPRLNTNISHGWIQGNYMPANRQDLTLKVRDVADTPLLTKDNLETDSNGFFQFDWWQTNQRALQAGDQINVFDGENVIASMEVTNLSIEPDYGANRIRGDAWPDTEVSVRIDDNESVSVDASQEGRYEVDPSPQILTQRNEIWAENYDNQANATIVVKNRLMLQTNLSHQWFQAQGLTPGNYEVEVWSGSQLKAKVNNIEADSNGNLWLDANRVREILLQWDFYYLNDDNIKVLSGQNVVASMDVAQPLTVNVDIGSNTVNGVAPVGNTLWLDVNPIGGGPQVFHYEYGEVPLSGNYIYQFNGDVNAGHEVNATVEDGDGNQTIVVGSSPRFSIWNYDWLEGNYLPPNAQIELRINGDKFGDTRTVDVTGRFDSWQEDGPQLQLQPGQLISVNYLGGSTITSWSLPTPKLTGKMDPTEDKITGTTADGNLKLSIDWWAGGVQDKQVTAVQEAYEANFGPGNDPEYNIQRNSWASAQYIDNQTQNSIGINFGAARLQADLTSNPGLISGNDFISEHPYTLEVTGSNGPKGTKPINTDNRGSFEEANWWGDNYPQSDLQAGDTITVKDGDTPVVNMTVAGFPPWNQNSSANVISGTTTAGARINIGISKDPDFVPEFGDFDGWGEATVGYDGNFTLPIWQDEDQPYDLGYWQATAWVSIEDNGNTTSYKRTINDEVGPTTPQISSSTHLDSNTWYNNNLPKFNWPAVSDGSNVVGYSWAIDSDIFSVVPPSPLLPGSSDISFLTSIPLSDGVHIFKVKATDPYSNSSEGSKIIKIDASAPDTQITSGPSGTITVNSATFNFTGTDTGGSGIAGYMYRLDGGSWTNTNSTSVIFNNLVAGAHTFEVKAKDAAGNEDPTPASQVFTYSPPPPAPSAPPVVVSPAPTTPAPSPQQTIFGTMLSLKASPGSIVAGKITKLIGQLKGTNGQAVAGKTVAIKAKVLQIKKKKVKKGKKTIIKTFKRWIWKVIAKVKTNTKGQFAKSLRPRTTTIYKAEFSGDSGFKKANSNSTKITVKKPKKKAKKKK